MSIALVCLLLPALLGGCRTADEAREPTPAGQTDGEERSAAAPEAAPVDAKAQLLGRLAGDWHMDLASLESDPQFADLPAQQRMQALTMARQMMADVTFSFTEDGKIRLGFGPTGRTGTYTVDKVEGHALHITTRTQGPEGETVEKVLLRIEGDALRVTEGDDGRTIRLLRGKPEIAASQPTGAPGSQPAAAPGSQPARAPTGQPGMPAPQPAK